MSYTLGIYGHIWPYVIEILLTRTSSETLGFVRKSGWLSARGHLARICVLHRRAISWWKGQKWSWWDRNRYWYDWSSYSFYAPILGIILLKTHRYHRPFHIALAAFWFCQGFKIAHMRPLVSKTWSSGSLAVGSRHMIQVKQEGQRNQAEIQAEIQASVFFFTIHDHVSPLGEVFNWEVQFF